MKAKLPIFEIFIKALLLPFYYYRELLKVGLPVIIFGFLYTISNHVFKESNESLVLKILSVLLVIVFWVFIVIAIIGCHRLFILGTDEIKHSKLFNWTGNELGYVGWTIIIAIYGGFILLAFTLILNPFFNYLSWINIDNFFIRTPVFAFIYIIIFYLISRWSLVLPACAIDKNIENVSWSWHLSRGNEWRLTFLIGFLPFLFDTIFNLLPAYDFLIYKLFTGLIWLIIGTIQIGLLSLSYVFISENNNETAS